MEGPKKVVDVNEAYQDLKTLGNTVNNLLKKVEQPKSVKTTGRDSLIKKVGLTTKVGRFLSEISLINVMIGVSIVGVITAIGTGVYINRENNKNTFTSTGIVQKVAPNCTWGHNYNVSVRVDTPNRGTLVVSKDYNVFTPELCQAKALEISEGTKIRFTGYPVKGNKTLIQASKLEKLE